MNESIEVEKIKGKYGTLHTTITAISAIICAVIALLGGYIQSQALKEDVLELKEQMTLLQNDLSALQKRKYLEIGDIVGQSTGFRQEHNETGEPLNQYMIKTGNKIVCPLGGKYEHFHAVLSQKDVGKYSIYLDIILDGLESGSWYIDSDFLEMPINADITGVQEMIIKVMSTERIEYHAGADPYAGYAVLSDTEIW